MTAVRKVVKQHELRPRDVIVEVRPDYPTFGSEVPLFLIDRPGPQKLTLVQAIGGDMRGVGKLFDSMVTEYLQRGGDIAKLELRVLSGDYTLANHEVRLSGMEKE